MSDRTLPALQDALAAEHAVIWGYGVVGAKARADRRSAIEDVQQQHRDRRDEVADRIRDLGGTPVEAQPAYDLPFAVHDAVDAIRLAAALEDGACRAWRYVLGGTDDKAVRTAALDALTGSAVQAVRWRWIAEVTPLSTAFPGQP